MNFIALKLFLKIHKNLRSRPYTHTRESTSGLVHMQVKRKIPSIVNDKIVIKVLRL